jgi:hypothetical protein
MTQALPPGICRYVQTDYGGITERTRITVTRRGHEIIISDTTVGSLSGDAFSCSDEMTLAPTLEPRRYGGRIRMRDRTSTASVTFGTTAAVVVGTATHGRPRTFEPLPRMHHLVVIAPPLFGGLFVLPAQLDVWRASAVTAVRPSFGDAQILATSPRTSLPRPRGISTRDRALTITGPDAATIWYDATTYVIDEALVPAHHVVIARQFDFV